MPAVCGMSPCPRITPEVWPGSLACLERMTAGYRQIALRRQLLGAKRDEVARWMTAAGQSTLNLQLKMQFVVRCGAEPVISKEGATTIGW
jgi:hypothetical protein